MHAHAELLQRFYGAFQRRDAEEMCACYHPDVRFSDPVFTDLRGQAAGDMWRMLCVRGKDLRLEFSDVQADDRGGTARWEAWYTFATTGRSVHNIVNASFEFSDGKIIGHTDVFNLHRWAGQALGLPGKLLGWTPLLQNKIRALAAKGLNDFQSRGSA